MAALVLAGWLGGLALLFRVAPAPSPLVRAPPPGVTWQSGSGDSSPLDALAVWTPAAFALSTPAGFSHSLRRERAGIAPPVHATRPEPAYLDDFRPRTTIDLSKPGMIRPAAAPAASGSSIPSGVFPPRPALPPVPRLVFPDGWESRLFSGIDLNFGGWTSVAWRAQIEMRFDAKGVPSSMLLTQASGLPEVDRRLARSANAWRLLEPSAPRAGIVAWQSPAAEPPRTGAEEGGP